MHASRTPPAEKRLTGFVLFFDEVFCHRQRLFVDCLHSLLCQRTSVFNCLSALTIGLGMNYAAWSGRLRGTSCRRSREPFRLDSLPALVLLPHSGDKGCRRIHRNHARSANVHRGHPDDSYRTVPWHTRDSFSTVAIVTSVFCQPLACGMPTFVMPLRTGTLPLMKAARPAVQLC